MKRDVIETLSLHFGCLEEQVTCSRVKPFLPGLLVPSVQIRIPTPITVHVDHCPQCAEDLKALRDFALTEEQLERLERLYTHKTQDPLSLCWRARSAIGAFVRGSFEGIDARVLNHLCTCPRCRLRVQRQRLRLLASGLGGTAEPTAGCEDDIPLTGLFDYAVPYGRVDTNTVGCVKDAVRGNHIRACPSCLRRIAELDEAVYSIGARTDSGVATVYSTAPEAKQLDGSFTDLYPEYPIQVQVIRHMPARVAASLSPAARLKAAFTRTTYSPEVRFWLKTAAVAAVIPLVLLLFHPTTTSGITLAQVVKAFGKAENVHVSKVDPITGRAIQEFWISRPANLVLSVAPRQRILYDLGAKKANIFSVPGASTVTTELSDLAYARVRRMMDSCLGFAFADVPRSATWTHTRDSVTPGLEVYELAYSLPEPSGASTFCRWRIAVEGSTGLPKEVQGFGRTSVDHDWFRLSTVECQYLTQDEMTSRAKELAAR